MTTPDIDPEPEDATALFGDRIDVARRFTENLAHRGEVLGLIGPLERSRLWSRHIVNSALLAPLLVPGRVGDVGTGAGLPGLVLAIARPDTTFVLIEPMERRVAWLNDQVDELGLENVSVIRARAEETDLGRSLDQVTARAVSALRKLIPLTAPLVRPGGELLLMKGAGAEVEIDSAEKAIRKYKLTNLRVELLGEGLAVPSTRIVRALVG